MVLLVYCIAIPQKPYSNYWEDLPQSRAEHEKTVLAFLAREIDTSMPSEGGAQLQKNNGDL